MKRILLLLIVFAVTISSCSEDFVNLEPEDSLSPGTFFKTDDHLKQAVAAAYAPLRDLLDNDYFTSEMRSDNTHYQPGTSRGTAIVYRENVSDWNNDGNNNYVNAVYYHCYKGISRANIVLGRLPQATAATPAVKASVEGQAKFLRAWNYFKLVRLFGEVPLYLKEVTKADEAFLTRSSVDAVYAQIISDAKDAVDLLLPPAKFPQTGEATKGSATMLLADVYVTLKRYAEAETLLNTLPAMGYDLNSKYEDAFSPGKKNGIESLFEVQYLEGIGIGSEPSNFIYQFLPRTTSTAKITGTPATSTTGSGGWNTPSPDLISAYEPGDKRLDISIGVAEGVYNATLYLVISDNKSIVGYTPAPGKVGVPYAKKYLHPPYVATNNTNDNWPIYRYSEALLLLAEALNEQKKSPLTPLNKVRARAGLLTPITETDQDKLRDIILHERRVELAFENKRFHDLQRSPKGLAIMKAYAVKAKATYAALPPTAFDIQQYKFLFPIPQPERGLNPALTQNDGYTF